MAQAKKLLIVDDEPDIRLSLSAVFTQMGHDVHCAEDGFSALEKIREAQPDIIVSDLNMPGMSGFELLSVVRRRLPSIYVIATSGAYSGEAVPRGIAADAFYEKAAGFRTLLRMLASAAESTEPPSRTGGDPPPIWISRAEDTPAGQVDLVINCPECLRNSSQLCVDSLLKIHETTCLYCGTPIHYAIIRPMDSITSQANQPGLNTDAIPGRFVASGGLMVRS